MIYDCTWVSDAELVYHRKRYLIKEVSTDDYFDIIQGKKDLEYKCGRIQLKRIGDLFGHDQGFFDKKHGYRVLPQCERVLRTRSNRDEDEEERLLDELYAYDENEPWWNR